MRRKLGTRLGNVVASPDQNARRRGRVLPLGRGTLQLSAGRPFPLRTPPHPHPRQGRGSRKAGRHGFRDRLGPKTHPLLPHVPTRRACAPTPIRGSAVGDPSPTGNREEGASEVGTPSCVGPRSGPPRPSKEELLARAIPSKAPRPWGSERPQGPTVAAGTG